MEKTDFYNHKTRRNLAKQNLMEVDVEIFKYTRDLSGNLVKVLKKTTSKWRAIKHHERHNHNTWFDRIQKSIEYGKKISRVREEESHNEYVMQEEAKSALRLQFLTEIYGEIEGKRLHNWEEEKRAKRTAKKYQID